MNIAARSAATSIREASDSVKAKWVCTVVGESEASEGQTWSSPGSRAANSAIGGGVAWPSHACAAVRAEWTDDASSSIGKCRGAGQSDVDDWLTSSLQGSSRASSAIGDAFWLLPTDVSGSMGASCSALDASTGRDSAPSCCAGDPAGLAVAPAAKFAAHWPTDRGDSPSISVRRC